MKRFIRKQSSARIIAFGFFAVILLGSILLIMPFSVKDGVHLKYIDALYTSVSAVCVTGLIAVDAGTTFTPAGQIVLALLIQTGGLGVSTIGAGIILAIGKKIDLKGMCIIKEASNLHSTEGIIHFIKSMLANTLILEGAGAFFSFLVFVRDMSLRDAVRVSLFHAVAAFNNSGFDILGGIVKKDGGSYLPMENLIPYQSNFLLNMTTCTLIILGGIGFPVILEIQKGFHWKKFSMHTKIVLVMTAVLLIYGTVLLKATENITWLGAFFFSVSARTAGFSTYSLNTFSNPGLLTLIALMYIGAAPGSTGGGIKITTFFTLLLGIRSAAVNKTEKAFKYSLPKNAFKKSSVIAILAVMIIFAGTYMISLFEPRLDIIDILLEVTSAFATVGLSTGITPGLSVKSKLISIIIMYIGRLGPLSIASLWHFSRGNSFDYPEGNIAIG